MKDFYEVHCKMVEKTIDAYRLYVRSNSKMNQYRSAIEELKKMVGNNGDIGMGYVVDKLTELRNAEKEYNERIQNEYYWRVSLLEEFELYADGIELGSGRKMVSDALGRIRAEIDAEEQKPR